MARARGGIASQQLSSLQLALVPPKALPPPRLGVGSVSHCVSSVQPAANILGSLHTLALLNEAPLVSPGPTHAVRRQPRRVAMAQCLDFARTA